MDYERYAEEYIEKISSLTRGETSGMNLITMLRGEYAVLAALSEHGELTPSVLAKSLGNSTARIANTLKSLEGKGYVRRSRDGKDKRRTFVSITDNGREQMTKKRNELKSMLTKLMKNMGPKDAAEYLRLQEKALKLMKAGGKHKETVN